MKDRTLLPMNMSVPGVLAAAVVLLTLILYLPAVKGQFYSDDLLYIKGNQTLQNIPLGEIWKIFTGMTNNYEYLPLRDLTYRIEMAVFGLDPRGFHAVNIVLYGLVCLALWHLSISLFEFFQGSGEEGGRAAGAAGVAGAADKRWFAFIVTALFAAHPAHVESVAWITGRKGLLSALFVLLAYWQFTKALLPEKVIPWRLYASYLLFLFALMSKSTVMPLAALAFLMAYIGPVRAEQWPGRALKALTVSFPFFLLAAASVAIQIVVGSKTGVYIGLPQGEISFLKYMGLPAKILGHLTRITFAPYGMRLTYDIGTHGPLAVALGLSIVIMATVGAVYLLRRRSIAAFGIITFFIFSLPFLQIVPFSTWSFVSERFLFMPLLGAAIFMAAILMRTRLGVRLLYPVVLSVLLFLTYGRAAQWSSTEILLMENAARSPESHYAVFDAVADVLVPDKRYAEATAMVQNVRDKLKRKAYTYYIEASKDLHNSKWHSTDQKRDFLEQTTTPKAHYSIHLLLGKMNEIKGDNFKAAKHYYYGWQKLRFIDELDFANALKRVQSLYGRQISEIEKCLVTSSCNVNRLGALGNLAMELFMLDKAERVYGMIIEQTDNPKVAATAHFNLGLTLLRKEMKYDAVDHIKSAIEMGLTTSKAYNSLGSLYKELGNYDKAFDAYKKAIETDAPKWRAFYNLGYIYKIRNQKDKALESFQAARKRALDSGSYVEIIDVAIEGLSP